MATEHSPRRQARLFRQLAAGRRCSRADPGHDLVYTLESMSEDAFMAWGWRVPFLLSAVLVITGLVIRVKVAESPEFDRVKADHGVVRLPVVEVLRTHPPSKCSL